jgi:hypothetical protein
MLMLLTPVSHRLRIQSRLQNEEEPSIQDASSQEHRLEQSKPAEEADLFLYVETPSPALQRRAVLNQGLNQMEATQVAKQYSSPDMFLSEQVGNPQQAKESVRSLNTTMALLYGVGVWGLSSIAENVIQRRSNRQAFQKLSAEAHSHKALAPLANVSEKNELLGKITTALSEKKVSDEAKAILTRIRAKTQASVADLHHALAGFKHLQARDVLERTPFNSKWLPLALGLGAAGSVLYSTYRHLPEAEKRQVETNRRNRAILNQAGRDITVLQAKENFPEYYSALACSQSGQT